MSLNFSPHVLTYLYHDPHNVNKVVLPPNGIDSGGVDVRVEEKSKVNGKGRESHSLGTDTEWKNLHRVSHSKRT